MGGHVNLQFVGQRWERVPSLVRILLETPQEGGFDTEASSYGSKPAEELRRKTTSTSRVRGR